jgi:hypothetical protein
VGDKFGIAGLGHQKGQIHYPLLFSKIGDAASLDDDRVIGGGEPIIKIHAGKDSSMEGFGEKVVFSRKIAKNAK